MAKYDKASQSAENKARIADQHRNSAHAYKKIATSLLKDIDWAKPLGMRRDDLHVFEEAAAAFTSIVIVRATNQASLPYIGQKGFAPKPIDCKPKTADDDAYVATIGARVKCAGLAVDPTVVDFSAFRDKDKRNEAFHEWSKFLESKTHGERAKSVFPRRASKGFFAVDTDLSSKHYGCIMLSEQNPPSPDFRLDDPSSREFKRNHMAYLHGDYDLYGLINIEETEKAIARHRLFNPERLVAELHGTKHIFTEEFDNFRVFVNLRIGVDMIQHAGKDNFSHGKDKLIVFYPNGSKYTVNASAEGIMDIYRYVFHQQVKD